MSICGGIAGKRGHNPKGIFIHNDAGSKNANGAYYEKWLPTHDLGSGFAHAYVASDKTVFAEDGAYKAWHCGQTDGNNEYYAIEVCQSMGDLEVFKQNEEKALQLAAQKCKEYGITPNANTIKLHQEVYATACPHRSVEIHGGKDKTKQYFISRIKEIMSGESQDKWVWDESKKEWWYKYSDGSYPQSCWKKIDGKWYYFDKYGYALRNTWLKDGNYWYCFNDDCSMFTGWLNSNGKWYYLYPTKSGNSPEGSMAKGWVKLDGFWYYLNPEKNDNAEEGEMITGLFSDGIYQYFCRPYAENGNPQGSMVTGWRFIYNEWYYFNTGALNCQPEGSMVKSHLISDKGKKYYLKENGVMAKNETVKIGDSALSFDDSGALK